jgi:hypothetical protein
LEPICSQHAEHWRSLGRTLRNLVRTSPSPERRLPRVRFPLRRLSLVS